VTKRAQTISALSATNVIAAKEGGNKRKGSPPTMPRTMETMVFHFDELSDKAKEKARDWYREGALDHDWWDSVYEDAAEIAKLTGEPEQGI
jgi:hypothetical protein